MQLIIFTDLDGTLLDHNTYSFAPALSALAEIKKRGYPLILCSSKTRAELVSIHRELELDTPFICENGAAVYWQEFSSANANKSSSWKSQSFSPARAEVLAVIHQLRCQFGYRFSGFSDLTAGEIAQLTGLTLQQGLLAAERDYTEPVLWEDSAENLERFCLQLADHDLRAVQGGRFLSIMGQFDKSSAMDWLIERYRVQQFSNTTLRVIALGDSPNDEAMLQAADIAVVIQSARSASLTVNKPQQVIHTIAKGPGGWQEAMAKILADTPFEASAADTNKKTAEILRAK